MTGINETIRLRPKAADGSLDLAADRLEHQADQNLAEINN